MTFASTSIISAKYIKIGKTVHFECIFSGTTGGTLGNTLTFTLPITAKTSYVDSGAMYATVSQVGASKASGQAYFNSTTVGHIRRFDSANLIAAVTTISVSGTYEAA